MPPIRRYLRITRYSVLEVRIYLDKPSDTPWLLSSRDDVLPRIIQEVRPKVLPKLREENENARKKGGKKKKKGVKDVVSQEDFEVTIFLTELSTRHSLLTKQKQFTQKPRLKSTGNKLTGWLNASDNPIHVEDEEGAPAILQEEAEDDALPNMHDIPEAEQQSEDDDINDDGDQDALFVSSSDEEFYQTQRQLKDKIGSSNKRKRKAHPSVGNKTQAGPSVAQDDGRRDTEEAEDDKKKLALSTSYDGFSIYGRILCLVVKRKGKQTAATATAALKDAAAAGGSQMMEQWVSTQAAQDRGLDEEEEVG